MPVRSFEFYAAGAIPHEEVWARVSDPHRWPEWTDVTRVEADPGLPSTGDVITTVERSTVRWHVITSAERLLELAADLASGGRLELGARVVRPASGSRLVLAARFTPASRTADLGFLLRGGPALRRRFDRWASSAVRVAPTAEDQQV